MLGSNVKQPKNESLWNCAKLCTFQTNLNNICAVCFFLSQPTIKGAFEIVSSDKIQPHVLRPIWTNQPREHLRRCQTPFQTNSNKHLCHMLDQFEATNRAATLWKLSDFHTKTVFFTRGNNCAPFPLQELMVEDISNGEDVSHIGDNSLQNCLGRY